MDSYEINKIQVQIAQSIRVIGMDSPAYIIEGLCVLWFMAMVGDRAVVGGVCCWPILSLAYLDE